MFFLFIAQRFIPPFPSNPNCQTTGHKDCQSADCCMYDKSKEVRDNVIKEIPEEAIAIVMNLIAIEG